MCLLLTWTVFAQETEPDAPIAPEIEPITATIEQAVPMTLTFNFPSADGVLSFAVPVVLNLDIRINISNQATASVVADIEPVTVTQPATPTTAITTRTVATPTPQPPTPTPTPAQPTATPAAEEEEEEPEATPTATATLTTTTATTTTAPPVVTAPACEDPRAVITAPGANQIVSGNVEIRGTATHEQFSYYKLEYTQGTDPQGAYAFLSSATVPVTDDLLSVWATQNFDNGAYTLRLTVVDSTGNFPPPCTVTVVVQN
jgi:hypothetical protein